MYKVIETIRNNKAIKAMQSHYSEMIINNELDEAYLIATSFKLNPRTILVIEESQYKAQLLYHQLKPLLPNQVYYFPCDESLRIEALAYSFELLGERINTLYHITDPQEKIIICHMHSYIRYLPSPSLFKESMIFLKEGMIIDPLKLKERLINSGYLSTQRVDQPFYFSRRGGVIDVFSIQYEHPIRIEFFDDEIESIHYFDATTQRRIESIKEVILLPASDLLYKEDEVDNVIKKIDELYEETVNEDHRDELKEKIELDKLYLRDHELESNLYQYMGLFEHTYTLIDYLDHPYIITHSKESLRDAYTRYVEENFFYFKEIQEMGQMLKGLTLYKNLDEILKYTNVDFIEFASDEKQIYFQTRSIALPIDKEYVLVNTLKDELKSHKIFMCLANQHQIQMMVQLMEDHEIPYYLVTNTNKSFMGVNIYLGQLTKGIEFIEEKTIFYSETELFGGTQKKKKYVQYKDAKLIKDYNELNIGDYVVHDVNGIGQYLGIETLEINGIHKDYLYIAYKGNDTLYIPVENFRLVRKYASRDGKPPKLHSLGSTQWQKEKQRVRNKVDDLADDLVSLYSERMSIEGFGFEVDNNEQIAFEEDFGYELTPDQKRSIDEIKKDMEEKKPMDRLLCGDVGFGKTEVALRAAFKAILSNKQVAFLCPTTILSSQHYNTALDRFKNFPVNIALLNRFTSTKEKNQILKDLKSGVLDLIIGTHRILSKDVEFKDIGLLIVDEEQRFGVRQKEKIKEYRKSIDVLTLTATPIPRTLQMSLMGIRGLSQIETPPLNRLPVQTYVVEKNHALIRQVIERELGRNGQVFYLYNRTENIEAVANAIQSLVPKARIGIGHGQMKKEALENVMNDFINKKYDILVCTTIIETGIDIPNANTIIVEDADHFGLAQLYQIKGRVGRSERVAYAYLMYSKNKEMNEEAKKRLKAIKEFAQLGSGYKIAMRDLSIRGCGDILGGEQAGFIDTVGFDMYMKILQEAIEEKTGVHSEESSAPVQNISVDGYIPGEYVESDIEKLDLYQRIYNSNTLDDLKHVEEELKDLYGILPEEIENIVLKRKYEILCTQSFIKDIRVDEHELTLVLSEDYSKHVQGDRFFELVNQLYRKPRFKYSKGCITLTSQLDGNWLSNTTELLSQLDKIVI